MSEDFRENKRQPARIPVQVRCAGWAEFIELHSDNISVGGLFVRSKEPIEAGTQVEVRIALPEGHGELQLGGKVVHVEDAEDGRGEAMPGMGLKLDELTPDQEGHLRALVAIAELAVRGGVKPSSPGLEALPAKIGSDSKESILDEADLFEDVRQGKTGRVSITAEVAMAAVKKLVEEKRYPQAERELATVLAEDPYHLEARIMTLVIEARQHLEQGKPDLAVERYKSVLQLDERHREAVDAVRSHTPKRPRTGRLFRK